MNQQQNKIEEDEIDLIALAKTLWNGRKTVMKITLIFMTLGLFVAIFSEKEYTASTIILPQTSTSKVSGGLSGLASLAGINLGSIGGGSDISPILYQSIINSTPFQKQLLQTPLTIEGEKEKVSFEKYYTEIYRPSLLGYIKKYTIGLPGVIFNSMKEGSNNNHNENNFQKDDLLRISQSEISLLEILTAHIFFDYNEDDGYVKLGVNMPEAFASAELAQRFQELLQQYVINFKIKKSSDQLNFIQNRYNEKEEEFLIVQKKIARFRDRNQNMNSALAQTSLETLQSQYDLTYNVFLELAKQLETQKIQVKEITPIFTIIEPVVVPIKKSEPQRSKILIGWTFFGLFIGIAWGFGKGFLFKLKGKWNEN